MLSFFPTAVRLSVGGDLVAAEAFFCRSLGFVVRERAEAAVLIDNGALTLRLVVGPRVAGMLELQCPDLVGASAELAANGLELGELIEFENGWCERRVPTPFGVELLLRHEVPEELRPAPVPLPASLPWESAAVAMLQGLLRAVPATFRMGARRAATARAEAATLAAGRVDVGIEDAARGYYVATPAFRRAAAAEELARAGLAADVIQGWRDL